MRLSRDDRLRLAMLATLGGMGGSAWLGRGEPTVVYVAVFVGFAGLCTIVALAARGMVAAWRDLRADLRAWRLPAPLGEGQAALAARANAQRAAERDVARSRFLSRRVTELVNRGVPVALAEQDAERLYDAVDVSSPYAG